MKKEIAKNLKKALLAVMQLLKEVEKIFKNRLTSAILGAFKILKIGAVVLVGVILGIWMAVIAAQAPSIHRQILREYVGNKVVMFAIFNDAKMQVGGGTGFHIKAPSGKTYILTNAHICDNYGSSGVATIVMPDGRYVSRQIIEVSRVTDLCLVDALPGIKGLELSTNIGLSETLAAVGHPNLLPLTVSVGDIIGKNNIIIPLKEIVPDNYTGKFDEKIMIRRADCLSLPKNKIVPITTWTGDVIEACALSIMGILTNIIAFPGNSGSPAVDFWGRVGGVVFATGGRTNYAILIPLQDIKDFLKIY